MSKWLAEGSEDAVCRQPHPAAMFAARRYRLRLWVRRVLWALAFALLAYLIADSCGAGLDRMGEAAVMSPAAREVLEGM